MKNNLVISTHKLTTKTASLLRSYCHLLKPQLQSNWVINNFDDTGDVLVIDSADESAIKSKAKIKIILSNCSNKLVFKNRAVNQSSYTLYLSLPISSGAIIDLFNKISKLRVTTPVRKIPKRYFSIRDSFSNLLSKLKINKKPKIPTDIVTQKVRPTSLIEKLLLSRSTTKLKSLKVVFLGRPAVGKTTAITSVCKKNLTTEVTATDSVGLLKQQTTVGIDFGEYRIDTKTNLRLFGTPGQSRYDFVQYQTIKNSDIYIILVNINSKTLQEDFTYFNDIISQTGNSNALKIIALTHVDSSNLNRTRFKQIIFNQKTLQGNIKLMDPRSKSQVQRVLEFAVSKYKFNCNVENIGSR
ncbi:MAG: 50S ribosome-binding GTPase [Proteobacteria bacterium]|nr:50S ribosome-binding GTPase [Pseudomonadota bacterium]